MSSPPSETTRSQRTVLIIDDDDASRSAMQTLLELDGFQVVTAADGQEGMEQLRSGLTPMAILLDLCMPRMDGFQFRSLQSGDPTLAAIPVVVYSAQIHGRENIAALNPAAYLEKPFEIDEFRRIFAQLGRREPPSQPPSLSRSLRR